jgi:tRNA G37 N-methylase Trm5
MSYVPRSHFTPEFAEKFRQIKLSAANSALEFWEKREIELKEKYGDCVHEYERAHIRKIKQYKKEAKAEVLYWESW